MLPQHGGVPNFSLRIRGPVLALLIIILCVGLLLTFSFHHNAAPGDLAAASRTKLTFIATLMLTFFVLLVATGRWWHPHLWRNANGQRIYRHSTDKRRSRRHHRSRH